MTQKNIELMASGRTLAADGGVMRCGLKRIPVYKKKSSGDNTATAVLKQSIIPWYEANN